MNAFSQDILRTITHSKKRFVSLVVITALGATMLTGLSMACIDLREAASALFTQQRLYDIAVQSTYGLTDDDLAALAQVDGVATVEGGYQQDTYTRVDGSRATVTVKALVDDAELNVPYVVEGRLPSAPGEVAVTENYLHESGKAVGDTLSFESTPQEDPTGLSDLEDGVDTGTDDGTDAGAGDVAGADGTADAGADEGDPTIEGGTYTIVGTVIDPANITQPEGPVAFRAATSSDYTFFVDDSAVVDPATYTVAYLGVAGTEGLGAYSDAYEARVAEVQERVEELAPQRERARTEGIQDDALAGIAESEADAEQQLADAARELDDAQATLDESLAEALSGRDELDRQEADALAQLNDAQAVIDTNRTSLAAGLAQLEQGRADLAAGVAAYNAALPGAEQQLRDGQAALDAARDEFYATTLPGLQQQHDELQATADALPAQIDEMDAGVSALTSGLTQLADGLTQAGSGAGSMGAGAAVGGATVAGAGDATAAGAQGAGSGDMAGAETGADDATGAGNDDTNSADTDALAAFATQLNDHAARITAAWDAVKAADAASADAAVAGFAQAVADTDAFLDDAAPAVTATLQTLTNELDGLIAQTSAGMDALDGKLDELADSIATAEAQLAAIDAQLAALPDDAPVADDGNTGTETAADPDQDAAGQDQTVSASTTSTSASGSNVGSADQPAAGAAPDATTGATPGTDAPSRAELEATRAALAEQLAQATATQQALQQQRDTAAAGLATLQTQRDALASAEAGLTQLVQNVASLNDPANSQNATVLAAGRIQAASGLAQAEAALPQLEAGIATARTTAEQEFAVQQAKIDAGWQELWDSYHELAAAQELLDANAATIAAGQEELAQGQAELNQRRADALAQIADARSALENGLAQIADGQAEIDDGRATLAEERQNAADQIADARQQVADVDLATWYVLDRSALGSYSSVDSDASSIETIAQIIPVIFFVVAILVSLTTATRMVDEERGLIGLYKALGYSKARILSKYLVYTVSAALIGGIIGDIAGFVVIPYILFYIFQAMYLLPLFSLHFNAFYAALGILAFVVGIGGSTFLSCRADLRETPATLMRPKAPRAGSRIFLERIRPLWRRMSFLNKVTARNLFRYKKRFAMTVFGIMGCTALLICGFSIKNTVESLAPRQYEQIYRYDLLAATTVDDYASCLTRLEGAPEVTSIEPIGVDNVTVSYDGAKESMQLYVIPRGASIDGYVSLQTLDGAPISLDEAGAVITNNAATVLGLDAGDTAELTTSALDKASVPLTAITRNYLGNAIYMTEDVYESLFGPLELNGFFCHLTGSNDAQAAFADTLDGEEAWLSITSVAKMREQFEQSFTLINVVVYVVIALAAGLAFVVLFTLSTVNIGEREREIATIKVLGFRTGEVRTYINKETFVLTLLGILVGLPAGWALSESFTYILKMPSIFFDVVVDPWCYGLAAAFSAVFAFVVSRITNRMLDRANMVEALKSPE